MPFLILHISYHIISYHIISYHIISYHIISYQIISYHIIYHIISYHIISYHIISYHIIYHIISTFILISYIKTNRHKNTTWYWGQDQKAIKAWENHVLNRGFNKNIQKLAKNTLYKTDKAHKNTQDMLQNEVNCIQIVKLISADFWSVWLFCNVLQFCPKNSKNKVHSLKLHNQKTFSLFY